MNKKELIASIKEEIKITGNILKANKKAFKTNQRKYNLGLTDYVPLEAYPFTIKSKYASSICKKHEDGKFYFNSYGGLCNYDCATAKCHLTCLHIAYNILRNKKTHCHNSERNDYYVRYFDKFIQGLLSQVKEEQNVVV